VIWKPAHKWVLAVLVAATAIGAIGAQQSDTVRNPLTGYPPAASEGQRVYDAACQVCHGPGGQGDPGRGAPALSVPSSARTNGDADLFRTIRSGIAGAGMPPFQQLSDAQIWQLVSYIRTLQESGTSAIALSPIEGDPRAGELLFFGKAGCSTCHEVNAHGGIIGPDLSNAGRLTAAVLRQKLVSPNDQLPAPAGARAAPAPVTVVVRTREGREIRGVRRNEDTYSVQMVDAGGHLYLFDKQKLASIGIENRSLMPDDYAKRLTTEEITDLVAYLRVQRGRDFTKTITAELPGGVGFERLRSARAEPQNWLMYWGDYQGTHFSPLSEIDETNVHRLRAAWTCPVLGGTSILEATPLVVDGVMYTTGSGNPATVTAIDARSGRQIWRWIRQQKVVNPYEINPFSRGVAVLGNRLFVGTLDAALIALDARTGQPLWEVQVADTMEGYGITSPPLVVKDKVITGIAGGEYATRGFIDAYEAATGKRLWRFYAIPGPGEPGNET
jgi:alcohol dehydrogenase (cytochrome c)